MVKIASLLPSSTEIVCALGLAEALVARSHECDYPPQVKSLPAVTTPKFDPDGRSYEIDQRVKAILQEATSVYRFDNQYFNRPGPRLVESLEILAEILHPEQFQFGHQSQGWVRLDG